MFLGLVLTARQVMKVRGAQRPCSAGTKAKLMIGTKS